MKKILIIILLAITLAVPVSSRTLNLGGGVLGNAFRIGGGPGIQFCSSGLPAASATSYWDTAMTAYWATAMTALWSTTMDTEVP